MSKKRYPVDPHLETRLRRNLVTKKYYTLKKIRNQAVIRDRTWTKYLEKELSRIHKRMFQKWIEFWDVVEDGYPEYCFITGIYIPPRFKDDIAIRPFKNGEWCYKNDYDKYLTHNVVSDKLFANSVLICIATGLYLQPMVAVTVRPRIQNNIEAFIAHIKYNSDGFDPDDLTKFLHEPHTYFRFIRSKYFLKPNGKPFPKQ